jgi:3-oxoacyl-[acyl-carrier-protein] synthase-3
MAFLSVPNIEIVGIAACVPAAIAENSALEIQDVNRLISTTGIARRRISAIDSSTADLCISAASKLLKDIGWSGDDVDAIIFVTQTPDYILPATSPYIQTQLGLSVNCYCLDISLGCSGYIYGLSVLTALMQNGTIKKAILLAGDTISKICSPNDKSTFPLFGDGGTATALEYKSGGDGFKFHFGNDGSGKDAIIVKDGGFRNMFSPESLAIQTIEHGIARNNLHLTLEGMDVFAFGISRAPESVNALLQYFSLDPEKLDYFVFHQANLFMNEKIRKKLKLEPAKVPYSLWNFGNTSCASIPLTMVTEIADSLKSGSREVVACGFGVGLSWGSAHFKTKKIIIPELLIYE